MIKKLFLIYLTVFVLLFAVSGCQSQTHTLAAAGEEIVSLMAEMTASKEYAALYALPAAYNETIAKLREGDYRTPSAVYTLDVSGNELLGISIDGIDVSERLSDYLHSAACLSLASSINQHSGMDALSVSTAYAAQMTFLCSEEVENSAYLYTFDKGAPIAVFFLPGEDSTIRAVGYFLLNDALNAESAEQMEASLSDIGISWVKVNKK